MAKTKAETLLELTTRRDTYQTSLDEIVANKVSGFGKGNFHSNLLKIQELQNLIQNLNNKITAWENSSL